MFVSKMKTAQYTNKMKAVQYINKTIIVYSKIINAYNKITTTWEIVAEDKIVIIECVTDKNNKKSYFIPKR